MMPAYWISLFGVPDSPVGIGVTARSEEDAIEMLAAMEIDWHNGLTEITFREIRSLDELQFPAIKSAIQRPISSDGIWFPVFDVDAIVHECVELTAELRFDSKYAVFRSQLESANIDPRKAILYSVSAGYANDETSYSIYYPPRNSATVIAKWDHESMQPLWIQEIDEDDYQNDFWEAEPIILWQMCAGKLAMQFSELVSKHCKEYDVS